MQATITQPPVDYRRKWYVMAAVSMGTFLATIDGSIVNIALPILQGELHTEFNILEWVVLAYLLTVTTLMLSIGRLADMIGKKPIYTTGFIIFTLGSALCGLSTSINMLIGCRVLQAVGAAMIMSLGTAIITEAFPPSQRGMALGVSGVMVSLGIIAGPTMGGIILGSLSWHWIFFVNLPVGLAGILMVLRFVPARRPPGGQRFDFAGAVTLFISLLAFLVALTLGQDRGFLQIPVLVLAGIFAIFLWTFIRIELKARQPMIDLRLFQNGLFSINLATGFLTFVCGSGTALLMPFYLQNVMKYDPRTTGLLLGVLPLAVGLVAPVAGSLSDRYGTRRLTVIGLGMLLCGYLAVSTLSLTTTYLGYALRFLPIGIGLGFFQSPNNSAIMGTAPRERLGVASGLLSITRTLGQITGISVMGALWASLASVSSQTLSTGASTGASPAVQVAALNQTSLVIVGVILAAFLLSLWALFQERRAVVVINNSPD